MMSRFSCTAAAVILMAASGSVSAEEARIKIGVMSDMSGIYADIGGPGSVEAARMAVEDFGDAVLGKSIEITSADHQNKPDVASNIARQWYDSNVDLIVDVPSSAAALAVQEVAREKKRLVIFSTPATSDLTGKSCSPYGIHWTYDTYALAHGTGAAVVKSGGKRWFFITADYAFGHAIERDTTAVVRAAGGSVLGSVKAPLGTPDFSSFLLQAQASRADIIGLANAGGDTINSIKQANEFGIVQGGQKLAGLVVYLSDVHSLGVQVAQGLTLTASFYWDLDDETRAWSKRFFAKTGRMPTMPQAGVYTSVSHYLKAVRAAGTSQSEAVMAKMKSSPINDFMVHDGVVRPDGRVLRDFYLFEVKSPKESQKPWDYYKLVSKIPAGDAIRPLSESDCPLVSNK